ncbi:DUF4350 domain-containing protein [Micromonospora sp. NPDC049366]|uniref:DUF4350 domain-containing protein n=1 Tax=Micromonospora sp. NPDC049366 TaxID=3364271 RepID=UPI00379B841B
MTAAAPTARAGATPGPDRPAVARPARRRRWHRLVIPFGLVATLIVTSLVTRAVDRADPGSPGYLSPVQTGEHGGSRLAEALRERGVTVQRETDYTKALLATRAGPATLFVPAPGQLHPDVVGALNGLPANTRLVLVDPSRPVLSRVGLPLTRAERRWAARAVGPQTDGRPCPLPELETVRRAAVERQRYASDAPTVDLCFSAGVARLAGSSETVVVGADDPFRNDRIDEHDNRPLAVGLLGVRGRVIWLDLRRPVPGPGGNTPAEQPGSDGPGDDDGAGDDGRSDGGDGTPDAPTNADGSSGRGDRDRSSADRPDRDTPNPLWDAFPLWFWALLTQLVLVLLLAALWRARRLGPPAPEPLPVTVRSAETVLGRAQLYRRAGARGPAARTLRAATLTRVLPRLNLPADAPPDRVAAAVAARTGEGPGPTEELLYGGDPATDQELLDLARALDRITRTVAEAPPGTDPTEGGPR